MKPIKPLPKPFEPLPKPFDPNWNLLKKLNETIERLNVLVAAYESHTHDVNVDTITNNVEIAPPLSISEWSTCQACGGKGFHDDFSADLTCSACHGTGKVTK